MNKTERELYEEDLRRRQQQHLDSINNGRFNNWQPCMHDNCPECIGTGIKHDGSMCIHMISCPCPKCTPTFCVTH
jgi:hypothetical protein